MATKRKWLEDALNAWGRLSLRERLMALGVGIAFVLFVIVLISFLVSASLTSIERRIHDKTQKMQTIIDLRSKILEAQERQQQSAQLIDQGKNIQLTALLETLANQIGVKIGEMRQAAPALDAESKVVEDKLDVTVPLITLDRLVDFLDEMERKSKTIAIRKIRVKKSFREPTQLEVAMTVSNFKPLEGGVAAPAGSPAPAPSGDREP